MLGGLYTTIQISRYTDLLLGGHVIVGSSIPFDRQPDRPAVLGFTIVGATTGSIFVTNSLGLETIAVDDSGSMRTAEEYSTVCGISCSGLVGSTVSVWTLDSFGERIYQLEEELNIKGYARLLGSSFGDDALVPPGPWTNRGCLLYANSGDILVGDEFNFNGFIYKVQSVLPRCGVILGGLDFDTSYCEREE